jgi:hypothetical protein
MLTAQAKIKLSDFSGALKVLQQLLSGAKLSNEIQLQALKLAIACAIETDRPAAIKLLNAFLAGYPQEEETPDYAVRLFKLYEHNSATETAYNKLGTWGLENRLQAADTVPLVLKCAGHITDKATKEKLLRGLLKRQDFTAGELAVLLEHLPGVQLKLEFIERYKKPFANTPELCVLYLRIAEIEMEQKNYLSALRHCEKLLSQKEVFRYKVCKLLQARAYMELKNETQGRQVYQELLLTSLKQEEKCQIIQELANSWERSGKAEKAIATAWTAIPLDGKITDETKPIVKTLLHLIIRNAEKINSQEDLKDARELLTAL